MKCCEYKLWVNKPTKLYKNNTAKMGNWLSYFKSQPQIPTTTPIDNKINFTVENNNSNHVLNAVDHHGTTTNTLLSVITVLIIGIILWNITKKLFKYLSEKFNNKIRTGIAMSTANLQV